MQAAHRIGQDQRVPAPVQRQGGVDLGVQVVDTHIFRDGDLVLEASGAVASTGSVLLTGAAANAECVWLGRRVVSLLWRDDLDTAFRHLDLYDRFGCPGGHIQATFRCVVKQGPIDPKATDSLQSRVHSCWVNPAAPPAPAAAAGNPAQGTSTQ